MEGAEGLKKNVEEVAEWRQAVGPDFPLMIDCYMSLTPQYTIQVVGGLHTIIPCPPPFFFGGGLCLCCCFVLTACHLAFSSVGQLAKAVEPYNVKWIEEFLPPDDYDGYEQVKKSLGDSSCLFTTGEHEYTRYGFRELIKRKAVDILQPDITW